MTKARVLIVDDQPNWRSMFSDLLEDEYEAIVAENAQEAAEMLMHHQDDPFHVAVIDIRLDDAQPGNEGGMEIARWLVDTGTRVVIVTGYPEIRTVRKAFKELQVFDYIEKYPQEGFSYTNFLKVVRDAASSATESKCDRGKLCDIIDGNSTDREIRKFQQALRKVRDRPEFRRFDDLRGPAKWDRIDHLLEIWESLENNRLCEACEIYRNEIRSDQGLEREIQAICSRKLM